MVDHGDLDADGAPRPLVAPTYRERLRASAPRAPVTLPANPLPEPDLAGAVRCRVALGGGARGGLTHGRLEGDEVAMTQLLARHRAWALNGAVGNKVGGVIPCWWSRAPGSSSPS